MLDDAVELEAAILVDGRHDGGVVHLQALKARIDRSLKRYMRWAHGH